MHTHTHMYVYMHTYHGRKVKVHAELEPRIELLFECKAVREADQHMLEKCLSESGDELGEDGPGMNVCVSHGMYVCIYIYICIYVYMYVYIYICMYICMYVCMHVCMYIQTGCAA